MPSGKTFLVAVTAGLGAGICGIAAEGMGADSVYTGGVMGVDVGATGCGTEAALLWLTSRVATAGCN